MWSASACTLQTSFRRPVRLAYMRGTYDEGKRSTYLCTYGEADIILTHFGENYVFIS